MEVVIWMACTVAALTFFLFIRKKRCLEELHVKLNDSFRDVDLFMKKRVEVHAKWAEKVAAYDLDAQGILAEMTDLLDRFDQMPIEEKVRLCEKLNKLSVQMIASAERCPRLRTSASYIRLRAQAESLIAEMPNACCAYNTQVKQLNEALRRFPANITAGVAGFEQKELFSHPEKKSAEV
ncbi:LemA family protein [Domibacillus tundrae]|uniref:LemA family protein n=1 Tax=Domibacillus tundrae TaxID=1587527 RepID=UPI003391DE41